MFDMIVFASLALLPQTQSSCAAIDALKAKTYGFIPSTLSAEARTAKSKEMDQLWDLVKSRSDGAVCLRQLLTAEKDGTFFLYDGASLLASLDQTESSLALVVNSVRRAPLAEIEAGAYVNFAIRLSQQGADITTLAERFLEHPAQQIDAPTHAMRIHPTFGALLLFGSLPIDRADTALIKAMESSVPHTRETAAGILALLMTEGGLKALTTSATMERLPAAKRAEIDQVKSLATFKVPDEKPTFTREQVLEHLKLLPRTAAEMAAAREREEKYQAQLPASTPIQDVFRHMSEGPPFTSLAMHRRFILSAGATLTAADLPALREWRRQSIRSLSDETLGDFMAFTAIVNMLISRLELYAEYRK